MKTPAQDAWIIAYHRFALLLAEYPEGKGYHRETCIDSVEFDEDGLMKKILPSLQQECTSIQREKEK